MIALVDSKNIRSARERELKQSQTIWFDVTHVAEFIKENSAFTGIERVVSMLVLELDSLDLVSPDQPNQINSGASEDATSERKDCRFILCRYDFKTQAYVAISNTVFRKTVRDFVSGTSPKPRQRASRMPPKLKMYMQRQVLQFATFVASSWFRPLIPDAAISLGSRILDRVLERRDVPFADESTPCHFRSGDLFVALGPFWHPPAYINVIISNCAAYKLRLFLAVYDLIPIRFRSWFPPSQVDTWSRSLQLGLRTADCVIALSRFGQQDLLAFCGEQEIPPPHSAVLRLGDEITADGNVVFPEITQRVKRYLKPGFVLVVSSIDVRKNQEFLIPVWERMYRQYGSATPYLILIGQPATQYSRIMKMMRQTKFVDGRIVILRDVGDRELAAFYQHALFTMFPSLAEGWGLPVGESVAYGRLCIASNATSIPEVAGPLVEYFDPYDVEHCYQLVERYAFDTELRSATEAYIKEQYRPTTWAATAESLAAILNQATGYACYTPAERSSSRALKKSFCEGVGV